jgi:hypothetical protein
VACSCERGDEPLDSGAANLVSSGVNTIINLRIP